MEHFRLQSAHHTTNGLPEPGPVWNCSSGIYDNGPRTLCQKCTPSQGYTWLERYYILTPCPSRRENSQGLNVTRKTFHHKIKAHGDMWY